MVKMLNHLHHIARTLPLYGFRILEDGPTAAELQLEADYSEEMEAALVLAYLFAINQVQPLFGATEAEMRETLLAAFRNNSLYSDEIYRTVRYYGQRGYNVGGQIGIDTLGLNGVFDLSDPQILANLETIYEKLSEVDGEYSLLGTTAKEVAQQVRIQYATGAEWEQALGALLVWYGLRAAVRSVNIANTESVRMSRLGLAAVFAGNGITAVIHRTAEDERVCPVCQPLNGKRYNLGDVFDPLARVPEPDYIPLHGSCRCYYEPVREGWSIPVTIWLGWELLGT